MIDIFSEPTVSRLKSIINSSQTREEFASSVESQLEYLNVLSRWITATNHLLYVEFSVPGAIEDLDITEMTQNALIERLNTLDVLRDILLQSLGEENLEKEERKRNIEQNTPSNT